MSVTRGQRPRRYSGTPLPETQRRLRPEDVLRGFLLGVVILIAGFVLGNFTFNEIAGRGTAYFVLAIAAGVVLTAVAYQRIELVMAGFILIAWLSIGNTPGVATGMTSGGSKGVAISQVGVAFLLFIWGVRSLARGQISFVRTPLNGLLVGYLALCVLSAINGAMFWDPAVARFWGPGFNGGREPVLETVFELSIRVLSVGAFWLFANNLHDVAWLRRITILFLVPAIVLIVSYLLKVPLPINSYSQLFEGILGCTLFAWLLEPTAPGTANRRNLCLLGWLALAGLIVFEAGYAIRWVSGGLNLYIGLYFVAFLRNKRLFLVMLAAGVALYFAGHAYLEATVVHKVQTSGDLFRVSMARASVLYALKFPLGIGPGNYRAYNSYYGQPSVWNTSTFSSAHGFYSQTLSELGFVGLILVLAFLITALRMLIRFYRAMPVGRSRTFVLGVAGMWAGLCSAAAIGDYLLPSYHNGGVFTFATTIYGWIGLGIGFAHARRYGLLSDQAKPEASAPPIPAPADYYPRRMGRDAA